MADQAEVQQFVQGVEDAHIKLQDLEVEKNRMMEEFNSQRAKMKELFLQKETDLLRKTEENNNLKDEIKILKNELDDVKSQLMVDSMRKSDYEDEKRKAEEEIASLQQLVHETVEESSSTRSLYDKELGKLQSYIQYLQKEIERVKTENSQYQQQATTQEHSLAPSVVINALTKGLAKKLDAFGGSQDEKPAEKTQEDVELLRSLVDPLEDQIRALKEKLRATDEQLQKCKECRHNLANESTRATDTNAEKINLQSTTSTNTSFEMQRSENAVCDMCSNYEAQLVKEQQTVSDLMAKVQVAEKAAERHKEDLEKEIGFRKEMEEKWNEKKEEHKQQVAELARTTNCTEQDLKELRQAFNQASHEMKLELSKLTKEREIIYYDLDRLQKENENLIGKYTIHSQELQSEVINLPDTVEELHELVLKNHQELIITKIGKESAEERVNDLQSNIMLLQDQIKNDLHERKAVEQSLDLEIKNLQKIIDKLENEKKQYLAKNADLIEKENRIEELEETIKKIESQRNELKNRVYSLQQELETTETVQRDFVRLSQSLQVQLEKIRESDTQVRWQHEEDIEECPGCRTQFSNSKRKQHCRHCGQIFCPNCLSRTVQSGPHSRPSKVCDVCHTLLVKSSAPYFSKEPPMT